jgi:hypothetical protein
MALSPALRRPVRAGFTVATVLALLAGVLASAAQAHVVTPHKRGHWMPGRSAVVKRFLGERGGHGAPAGVSVGTVQLWPAETDPYSVYLKRFRLRAVSRHAEIWVADDDDGISKGVDFPAGDCRNGALTEVTDAQVRSLAREFDDRIYPLESHVFEKMPVMDGSHATLPGIEPSLPADAYRGPGRRLVVLVDNFRNSYFYEPSPALGPTGYVDNDFITWTDRHVVNLSSFDWLHSFGPNPPQQRPPADLCTNLGTLPNLVQDVLAHEYQHDLSYTLHNSFEDSWVEEGMADWIAAAAGYANTGPVDSRAWSWTLQTFLGFGANSWLAGTYIYDLQGGPQDSLTSWGGGDVDYGAAKTFFLYVAQRYGARFVGDLHREPLTGVDGFRAVLERYDRRASFGDALDGWAASTALDGVLDDGAWLHGGRIRDYEVRGNRTIVNWENPDTYDNPGVEPNGSDFVRLRDGAGKYVGASGLRSLRFAADSTFPAPMQWTVDPDGHGTGNAALASGADDNADRTLVRRVSVPVSDPTLRYDIRWDTEEGWDFGVLQVSTDGGATYHSLPATDTTSDHDPDLVDEVASQTPGYTGDSGGWRSESADLSAYAGQDVVIAFRYLTDGGFHLPGLWVDTVSLGGNPISDGSDLTAWQTAGQLRPPESVEGWTLQLVGYTADHHRAWISRVPLGPGHTATLDATALRRRLGSTASTVAAIVTLHDSAATSRPFLPRYELQINGVPQPGG